ncbi:MAG: aminotransferase class V-fold PLP-dependent enzyme [Pseudobdellovibrionaceae bacterium]
MNLDSSELRNQFPILETKVSGKELVYLDSAATSLKPNQVIERIEKFYKFENSNVHRGAHFLSDRATHYYEQARNNVKKFINAVSAEELVFVRGTTEGINLVAMSYGDMALNAGDEILITETEHHANIVPWQMLASRKNCKLKTVDVKDNGELDLSSFDKNLNSKTKIVALTYASNTLGTINPIQEMTEKAHKAGAKVLVDAAQIAAFRKIDVQKLDCDFLVFSGHKMFAPFGIGILYGKKDLLEQMPPYQCGGSMISEVSFSGTTFNSVPTRFEAGTPNIGGAVALSEAINFIEGIGLRNIEAHEKELLEYATKELSKIAGVRVLGEAKDKVGILSFNIDGIHSSDLGSLLNEQGIAVRTGHLCTQPLMKRFGITSCVRASFSIYNTKKDVDRLIAGILKAKELFA